MDAKANTHVCPSPFRQDGSMGDSASAASAYMIVVSGSVPGTMLPLKERGTTLGRSSECEFQIDDITVSRRHALVAVGPEGIARITDLGSAERHVRQWRSDPAAAGDRGRRRRPCSAWRKVVFKMMRLDPHDERFQRDMFERTVRDTLTGLYHRAYFLSQIGVLAERYASNGIGLAILMLDIDHFKQINDRHGHLAGDDVLRKVGRP